MTRYESNAAVKSGYYFNPVTMSVVPVARDGERLPNEKGIWISVPTFAALALTPILGALFLMFLPMIGFVLCGEAAGKKLVGAIRGGAGELAATMAPGMLPGEAHLTGKGADEDAKAKEAAAPEAERLAKLEQEISEKRK
jgi:succinate dehydrogenase/fumarate reductase flavoprotein subunit